MKTEPVGTRLEPDLYAAFVYEMKRRGQTKSQFLQTIIRDALQRYDSSSEQILQTQLEILSHLKRLEAMAGATVHLEAERNVLAMPQDRNETFDAYRERLRAAYRAIVFEALGKGARIAAVASDEPAAAKVS
jgi:hypothetical protein